MYRALLGYKDEYFLINVIRWYYFDASSRLPDLTILAHLAQQLDPSIPLSQQFQYPPSTKNFAAQAAMQEPWAVLHAMAAAGKAAPPVAAPDVRPAAVLQATTPALHAVWQAP